MFLKLRAKMCELTLIGNVMLSLVACGRLDGYELVDLRFDDIHLMQNDDVVIGSTIVDMAVTPRFIVGIRLPIEFLTCKFVHKAAGIFYSSEIQRTDAEEYFVVDRDFGAVFQFDSLSEFEGKLKELDIEDRVELDYSRFESVRQKFDRFAPLDAEECHEFPVGSKGHNKSTRIGKTIEEVTH